MPWCPVCKNEYKEGFKVCADCGADLVASLEEISVESVNIPAEFEEITKESETVFDESEEVTDNLDVKQREAYKPFVKAKDREQEYKSSGFALLIVGIGGLIFLALCVFGVIGISIGASVRSIAFFVMLFMFLAFIYLGIRSFVAAKAIGALAGDEDLLTADIENYFKTEYSKEKIDELALNENDANLEDEVKYFKRISVIKDLMLKRFGELEESYTDNMVEVIFGLLYDRN